jgi:carbonic anhydrase/acetyltransferase-like protein (isoleucine patch superfamily)
MIVKETRGKTPKIHTSSFVAANAAIIGDVEIAENCSIWYSVTIRGDVMPIRIGKETNIQDGSVIHGTYQEFGTQIAERVTIGHMVMLHGCEIEKGCLIGMGAIIMDGCKIGEHSLIGAGTLLTEGTIIPPRSLVIGRPGKVKRTLTEEEVRSLEESADHYLMYKNWY